MGKIEASILLFSEEKVREKEKPKLKFSHKKILFV
jgi:hypothetical protein